MLTNIAFLWRRLCCFIRALLLIFRLHHPVIFRNYKTPHVELNTPVRQQRKPKWVKQEVIRLKAFMIHDGCRKIADTFNRLHGEKRHMTVGKTYVYNIIQQHRYEINILRRKLKNKLPRTLSKNLIWAMDLTQVTDAQKHTHTVFGIVDSGTRACLHLRQLPTKASITLLRNLLNVIELYGKPKAIRTDNEAVFTSRVFRFGLWLLNIKHQRTEVCCPWMNGRVERFFGTLKQKLKHHIINCVEILAADLGMFRFWYNHVRTHQYLNGCTPAEVWGNRKSTTEMPQEFLAWGGVLAGVYFLPP